MQRAEGPSRPGSAPLTEGSPRLTWAGRAGRLQEGHRLQQLPMARHVGSGPRCRAFSSPLLLLGLLNDCPRRSCVALHNVVYRPQSRLPPSASAPTLRSRQGQMLAIGLRMNLGTQSPPGEVGKEMSCNPRPQVHPQQGLVVSLGFSAKAVKPAEPTPAATLKPASLLWGLGEVTPLLPVPREL